MSAARARALLAGCPLQARWASLFGGWGALLAEADEAERAARWEVARWSDEQLDDLLGLRGVRERGTRYERAPALRFTERWTGRSVFVEVLAAGELLAGGAMLLQWRAEVGGGAPWGVLWEPDSGVVCRVKWTPRGTLWWDARLAALELGAGELWGVSEGPLCEGCLFGATCVR
jgi:hypothetical protein